MEKHWKQNGKRGGVLFFLFLYAGILSAQLVSLDKENPYNPDSVRAELDKAPYFTLFKDNYFTVGTALGNKPDKNNSNVKFQLSIMQRLTKSKLPLDSYLFIQYTQKTIWNVFQESLPMHDLNFNPGIGLGHLIIHKDRYIGKSYVMLEHESNGKDSTDSRSWNKITFAVALMVSRDLEVQLKTWIPIIDSKNNKDILEYNGLVQAAFNYRSPNRRLNLAMINTWRTKSFSFNTQVDFSFKVSKKENQFLFLQLYNGYGENLLDYNKFQRNIRIGFVIKPQNFSIY